MQQWVNNWQGKLKFFMCMHVCSLIIQKEDGEEEENNHTDSLFWILK